MTAHKHLLSIHLCREKHKVFLFGRDIIHFCLQKMNDLLEIYRLPSTEPLKEKAYQMVSSYSLVTALRQTQRLQPEISNGSPDKSIQCAGPWQIVQG